MLGQLLILNYITYGKDRLRFVGRTFGLLVLFFIESYFSGFSQSVLVIEVRVYDNARLWIRSISSLKYFGME